MPVKKETNTYLKGDILEAKAFDVFTKLLDDGRFFISGKFSKIFRQKKYFSRDRGANIVFDLAIETTMPSATEYSLLTLIECKNYGSSVQVGDIESFSDKVRQVGGHKGIMVTTSRFQKSTLAIARARKIGVARIFDANEVEWINRRVDENDLQGKINDFDSQMEMDSSINSAVLGAYDGFQFTSFPDLFTYFGIIDQYYPSLSELKVPYRDDGAIERRISELGIEHCYDHFSLNIERLCIYMSQLYDVDFIFKEVFETASHSTVLGKISYNPLTIHINPSLRSDAARWKFTIAHEIGHLVFHSGILQEYFAEIIDSEDLGMLSSGVSKNVLRSMEIQANRFAAFILMPEFNFKRVVAKYFDEESIQKGFLFFDHQPANQRLVMKLLSNLVQAFGVSKEAAKVRLKEFGFLKDVQDVSFDAHLRRMGYK